MRRFGQGNAFVHVGMDIKEEHQIFNVLRSTASPILKGYFNAWTEEMTALRDSSSLTNLVFQEESYFKKANIIKKMHFKTSLQHCRMLQPNLIF